MFKLPHDSVFEKGRIRITNKKLGSKYQGSKSLKVGTESGLFLESRIRIRFFLAAGAGSAVVRSSDPDPGQLHPDLLSIINL